MADYLRPVDPTNGRMSTYWAHTHRVPKASLEAGVDYYCPIGTPIRAAGPGRIFAAAGGIAPDTGRYVTLDLDDGRRVRYLHLSRFNVKAGRIVERGDILGWSGASGYGSEFFGAPSLERIPSYTGGPHVHTTLWGGHYYQFGRYPLEPTLDFEKYVQTGSTAGSGKPPTISIPKEWDEMATEAQIEALVRKVVREEMNHSNSVQVYEVIDSSGAVKAYIAAAGMLAPIHITNPTDRDVLDRFFNGKQALDRFNSGEQNIIRKWLPLLKSA